jgi:hypothetical protein
VESFGESLLKSRFSFLKLLGNIRWLCPHWTNLVRLIQSGVTHNADVLVRSIGRSLILLERTRLLCWITPGHSIQLRRPVCRPADSNLKD